MCVYIYIDLILPVSDADSKGLVEEHGGLFSSFCRIAKRCEIRENSLKERKTPPCETGKYFQEISNHGTVYETVFSFS